MKKIFYTILLIVLSSILFGQNSIDPEDPPLGWWRIPKTDAIIKVGGYVKLDVIHDFNPIGSPDFFDISKIPTDGLEGQTSHLNAKESRLFVDFRKNTKIGTVRTYVEGDFYGSGGAFRLRHAYVELGGKWLVGQWWSNFMDESIIPPTLDFEKPAAYAFSRQPMIRFKQKIGSDNYFAASLERPGATGQDTSGIGTFNAPLPDLTLRYRISKKWGHIQLTGFAGAIEYRINNDTTDMITLFGGNLSGQFKFLNKDRFYYQVVYGPGVGSFRGGLSAAIDDQGDLKPITDLGITVGILHYWVEKLSTNITYNYGTQDNFDGQPTNSFSNGQYAAVNLLWHFLPGAFTGIEYLWGQRVDKNDMDGVANRVQFSVKYVFN